MAFNPYQKGFLPYDNSGFQNAAQYALPSAASRDTAAARVRSRISGQTAANLQRVNDTYAQRGMTNSGARDRAVRDTYAQGDNALASGLTDLELGYSGQQQQGAQILGNMAQQQQALANDYNKNNIDYTLGQGNLDLERLLGQGRLANEIYQTDTNANLQGTQNSIDLIQALGLYGLVQPSSAHPWGNDFNTLFHGAIQNAAGNATRPLPTRNLPSYGMLLKQQQQRPIY